MENGIPTLLLYAIVVPFVTYWMGRIDGYWKRAKEDREREKAWGDSDRLDWLDSRRYPVVEGQTQSWPYGEHVSNSWTVEYPSTSVRDAIDKASGKTLLKD